MDQQAADLPRTKVEVRRSAMGVVLLVVDAELAATAESRTRGLMERATLPANRGMLFLFETAQQPELLDAQYADSSRHDLRRRTASHYRFMPRYLPANSQALPLLCL